ncbi:hypothetical protein M0804_009948 [Polistes exclamans]|nr:hypothetical protein M0804_009948 [Polistes exclamans]
MVQLKYRFDREIDRLKKPCLRRILEKDDCASKRMVLCVSSINLRKIKWDTKLGYTHCPGPMLIKLKNVCPSDGLVCKFKVIITRTYPMLYHEKNPSGESIIIEFHFRVIILIL